MFWLDVLLLALFLLIQSPRVTGVFAHEAMGIAIAVPLVLHLLLSWQWIVTKWRRLRSGASLRSWFNFAVNAALFVAMVLVIASGVPVSESLLPLVGFARVSDMTWLRTHDSWANVVFILLGAHLAMNWAWLVAVAVKRPPPLDSESGEALGAGAP